MEVFESVCTSFAEGKSLEDRTAVSCDRDETTCSNKEAEARI